MVSLSKTNAQLNLISFFLKENKMLSNLDAIHISAVLEDCADQIAILGHIMPTSLEGRPDASQVSSLSDLRKKVLYFDCKLFIYT